MARGGVFAKIAKGLPMGDGVVPDEARRGIGHGIVATPVGAAARITARPAGKGTLDIIVGQGAVRPLVPFGAHDAGAIGVIKKDKIADKFMLVRRDVFAENA